MKQLELIVLYGPPASGKSTYAKQWQQEDPDNRVIVCREEICNMLGVHPGSRSMLADDIEKEIVNICLSYGKNVVVDSTRKLDWEILLREEFVDIETWETIEINIVYKEFGKNLTVDELVERDRARGSKTGEKVIRGWKR